MESSLAEAEARLDELGQQERLSRVATTIELPEKAREAFGRVRDAFATLGQSAMIWDCVAARGADRARERTTATATVSRTPVTFGFGRCDLIESEWEVPRLANANGGDIYLYPGFVLFVISTDAFALIAIEETEVGAEVTSFHETQSVPPDGRHVGFTWAKANKDGSADKRFKNNFQIPVIEYGELTLSSATGLNERYLVSNPQLVRPFATAWSDLQRSLSAKEGA
jgi:hypothetical protein